MKQIIITAVATISLFGSSIIASGQSKKQPLQEKPTEMQSRLVAMVSERHDGVQYTNQDSFRVYWTGTNHSGSMQLPKIYLYLFFSYPYINLSTPSSLTYVNYDSLKTFKWNASASIFNIDNKTLLSFDANGNLLSKTSLVYNVGNWENDSKTIYTYDAQSNLITEIDQVWDGTVWENKTKAVFDYDAQNNLTMDIRMDWIIVSSSWGNNTKKIFEYDTQNNFVRRINQYWTSGVWKNSYRYSFTYSNNNRNEEIVENWNDISSQWENDEKIEYSYDTNNNRIEDFVWEWETIIDTWKEDSKRTYNYDGSGNITSQIFQSWTAGNWEYVTKKEYNYSSGNLGEVISFEWNNSSNQMDKIRRSTFTYNSNDKCTLAVADEWDGVQWMPQNYNFKVTFYYEEYDDGINNDDDDSTAIQTVLSNKNFKLYPNPAKDKLTVQLAEGSINHIQITNTLGQVVFQSKAAIHAGQVTLPVGQLAPGVYYLKVQSGEKKGVQSFIVKH